MPAKLDDDEILSELRTIMRDVARLRYQVVFVHAAVVVGNLATIDRSLRGVAAGDRGSFILHWAIVIVASGCVLMLGAQLRACLRKRLERARYLAHEFDARV